jgi:hypothetical protein
VGSGRVREVRKGFGRVREGFGKGSGDLITSPLPPPWRRDRRIVMKTLNRPKA